jgi:membrane-associated phospholipid phosphatase
MRLQRTEQEEMRYKRRVIRWSGTTVWLATLWGLWFVFNLSYMLIRSLGDDIRTPISVEHIDGALSRGETATYFLQSQIFERDTYWLDYFAFLMHGLWFGVPFAFGLVLMIYRRDQLLAYLGWTIALFHLAALIFLLMPVRPPWMEPDIVRVLDARNFYGGQTSIDNNPYAAIPSLHAALPALTAMYFFLNGSERLRFYAWLATIYTAAVSFAIVYLGEHWVVDVLAGYAVAGVTAVIFTSTWSKRMAAAIPGDPVGRLQRLNAVLTRSGPAIPGPKPVAIPADFPPERRAA